MLSWYLLGLIRSDYAISIVDVSPVNKSKFLFKWKKVTSNTSFSFQVNNNKSIPKQDMNSHTRHLVTDQKTLFSFQVINAFQCNRRTTQPDTDIFTLRTVFTSIKQMFIEDNYAEFNVCKHLWTLNNHVINVCVLAGIQMVSMYSCEQNYWTSWIFHIGSNSKQIMQY